MPSIGPRGQANGDPAPLNNKPVAIIGGGGRFGGVRAQMHLREILLHNNMPILGKPQFMLAALGSHFDDELRLKDEETRGRLQSVLLALGAWTVQMQPTGDHVTG